MMDNLYFVPKGRNPFQLVYKDNRAEASKREAVIKALARSAKTKRCAAY